MGISYCEPSKKFILETARTAYCLAVDQQGVLQHVYWGKKLPYVEDYPGPSKIGQTVGIGKNLENERGLDLSDFYYPYEAGRAVINEEYPGWGGLNFIEPCLKLTFPDGVRDLVLKYHSHRIDPPDMLVVTLKDVVYPLSVRLHYRVFVEEDLVTRRAEIENECQDSVWLESVQSGAFYARGGREYRLTYLCGRWANEFNITRQPVQQGKKVMGSRRGITSHHESPWFALDPEGASTEQHGQVWFGTLGWSGNWKMVIEYTSNRQMRVTAGINDFDFAWELMPGESFITPEFTGGYTEAGFGGASRLMHRYALDHIYPEARRSQPWPVFYNTWETFWFDFDEQKLLSLAERAASLGIEVFHIDDGWFGTRQNEYSGLGDWTVNRLKFPEGLGRLAEKVKSLGMGLSLWIEPENVNLDSQVYRAHPEWVYGFPTRAPTIQRESLILNLGKSVVREHIWRHLSRLIEAYGVSHFKWDLNRHMSEPGWFGLPGPKQKELWVRHVLGVYELKELLKTKYPGVTLECCSGGGGRVDYGILKTCELSLPSDNHDPLARLLIQEGYSQAFPAKTMGAWVTDNPSPLTGRSLPAKFMFHTAMMGAMGIQANLLKWDEQEMEYAREMICLYKQIRPTIQEGDLYRLATLRTGHMMAVQYVSRNKFQSVIFAFMQTNFTLQAPMPNIIRWGSRCFEYILLPQGLLPDRRYHLSNCPVVRSGEALMSAGLPVILEGDGDSALIRIELVEDE